MKSDGGRGFRVAPASHIRSELACVLTVFWIVRPECSRRLSRDTDI